MRVPFLLALLLLPACDTTADNPSADPTAKTCADSDECSQHGFCHGELGACYPKTEDDCANSADCQEIGQCGLGMGGPDGWCAVTPSGCGFSDLCKDEASHRCHADWSVSVRTGVCSR